MKLKTKKSQERTTNKQIQKIEEELQQMEEELNLDYYEMGKTILETVETEGKKVNELVDQIIAAKKKLAQLKAKNDLNE